MPNNNLNNHLETFASISNIELQMPAINIPEPYVPAKHTHERLLSYIKDFEDDLDDDHEVGAKLVSFGSGVTFHILKVGYSGPDIITFNGILENGDRVQLVQNISQLNVLLVAMTKLEENPRRIGFHGEAK